MILYDEREWSKKIKKIPRKKIWDYPHLSHSHVSCLESFFFLPVNVIFPIGWQIIVNN